MSKQKKLKYGFCLFSILINYYLVIYFINMYDIITISIETTDIRK